MGTGCSTPAVHQLQDRACLHKLVQDCCTYDIVAWYRAHKIPNKMSTVTIHSMTHQSKQVHKTRSFLELKTHLSQKIFSKPQDELWHVNVVNRQMRTERLSQQWHV